MSQPIHLFDKNGKAVVLYAPAYAKEQVDAGLLFEVRPKPAPKTRARKPAAKKG